MYFQETDAECFTDGNQVQKLSSKTNQYRGKNGDIG
jgi:hypothetical protein